MEQKKKEPGTNHKGEQAQHPPQVFGRRKKMEIIRLVEQSELA
jgi:hypothetical protein